MTKSQTQETQTMEIKKKKKTRLKPNYKNMQ